MFSLDGKYYNLNGKLPHITYEYTVPQPSPDATAVEGVATGSAHSHANLTYNKVNGVLGEGPLRGVMFFHRRSMSSCRKKRRSKSYGRSGRPAPPHQLLSWSTDQMMAPIICTATMKMMWRRGGRSYPQAIVSRSLLFKFS